AIDAARAAVVFAFSVVAIIGGIGLIGQKGWSRWLTVFGSIVMILQQLAYGIYAFTTYFPAMERWQQAQGAVAPGFGTGMRIGGLISMVVILAIPVILLVGMLLPAVGEALRPRSRRRKLEDQYDDDYDREGRDYDDFDDRPRRRPIDDDRDP